MTENPVLLHPVALLEKYCEQQRELFMPDFFFSKRISYGPVTKTPHIPSPAVYPDIPVAVSGKGRTYNEKRTALAQLFYLARECKNCKLAGLRKKQVFGAGNASASVMIVGEAPGADEDRSGMPFVGLAGQLLTKMLQAIDLNREKDVFITNILKCRPPGNRDPESSEVLACAPILSRQIEIIAPKVILVLGRIAAHELLDTADSIAKLRARNHEYKNIPVVVTYHPAALLRNPQYKRPAWEDLKKLKSMLKGN